MGVNFWKVECVEKRPLLAESGHGATYSLLRRRDSLAIANRWIIDCAITLTKYAVNSQWPMETNMKADSELEPVERRQKTGGIPQICDSHAKRTRSILLYSLAASAPNGLDRQILVVDLT